MGRKSRCQKLLRIEEVANDYFVNCLDSAVRYWIILDRTRNWACMLIVCTYGKSARKTVHNLVGLAIDIYRDRHAVVYSLGGTTYGKKI